MAPGGERPDRRTARPALWVLGRRDRGWARVMWIVLGWAPRHQRSTGGASPVHHDERSTSRPWWRSSPTREPRRGDRAGLDPGRAARAGVRRPTALALSASSERGMSSIPQAMASMFRPRQQYPTGEEIALAAVISFPSSPRSQPYGLQPLPAVRHSWCCSPSIRLSLVISSVVNLANAGSQSWSADVVTHDRRNGRRAAVRPAWQRGSATTVPFVDGHGRADDLRARRRYSSPSRPVHSRDTGGGRSSGSTSRCSWVGRYPRDELWRVVFALVAIAVRRRGGRHVHRRQVRRALRCPPFPSSRD